MLWLADIKGNRETLKRIVVLLFSLAMLADEASRSSRRVRSEMLQHIRRAQLAAWSMTLLDAYDLYAEPDLVAETFACGDSPADAAHLAVVLRSLALILIVRFQLDRDFQATGSGSCLLGTEPELPCSRRLFLWSVAATGGVRAAIHPQAIPP